MVISGLLCSPPGAGPGGLPASLPLLEPWLPGCEPRWWRWKGPVEGAGGAAALVRPSDVTHDVASRLACCCKETPEEGPGSWRSEPLGEAQVSSRKEPPAEKPPGGAGWGGEEEEEEGRSEAPIRAVRMGERPAHAVG